MELSDKIIDSAKYFGRKVKDNAIGLYVSVPFLLSPSVSSAQDQVNSSDPSTNQTNTSNGIMNESMIENIAGIAAIGVGLGLTKYGINYQREGKKLKAMSMYLLGANTGLGAYILLLGKESGQSLQDYGSNNPWAINTFSATAIALGTIIIADAYRNENETLNKVVGYTGGTLMLGLGTLGLASRHLM